MQRGGQEGNTNAAKESTGRTISLYLPPETLPAIEKILAERGEDASEKACLKEVRKYALDGIAERLGPSPLLDQLRFMISNWQALVNHAEVFVPELLQNDRWIAMKTDLERRTDALGVTAFIMQIAEYRRRVEEEEDE